MRLTFSVCRDVTRRASLPPSVASGQLGLEHPGLLPSGPEALSLLALGRRGRGPSICPSCLSVCRPRCECLYLVPSPGLPLPTPRSGNPGHPCALLLPTPRPIHAHPEEQGPSFESLQLPGRSATGVGGRGGCSQCAPPPGSCSLWDPLLQRPRAKASNCSHQPHPRRRGGEEPQTLPGRCPGTPVSQSLDLVDLAFEGSQDCPGGRDGGATKQRCVWSSLVSRHCPVSRWGQRCLEGGSELPPGARPLNWLSLAEAISLSLFLSV